MAMTWAAGGLLGFYALLLGYLKTQTRRSDPAGNALASAYWAFALAAWMVLAAMTAIGWWLHWSVLLLAPLLPVALPTVYVFGRALVRAAAGLTSRMPTPELRRAERAAKDGHGTIVQEMVRAGFRIDNREIGRSLLRSALKGRYARDVIPALLDAGADGNDPALMAMALGSPMTSLRPFLEHGADPNTIHPSGDPFIFVAMEGGWTDDVRALLHAGADLTKRDREGWTVLMAHATGRRGFGPGNWTGIAELLEKGADLTVPAPDGRTLADLFAKAGLYEIHPDRLPAIRRALGL
jgi:hypothetical protein